LKVRTPGVAASAESVKGVAASAATPNTSTASKLANGLKAALGMGKGRQLPAAQPAPAPKTERQTVIEQLEAAEQQSVDETENELPQLDLLIPNEHVGYEENEKEVRRKAKILEKTFKDFGFNIRVVEIETGPVI